MRSVDSSPSFSVNRVLVLPFLTVFVLVSAAQAAEPESLLEPFGYNLGGSQSAALAFHGDDSWEAAKAEEPRPQGLPEYEVRINHKNGKEFYTLTYWKGELVSIERNGLFMADNAEAEAAYQRIFPLFQKSVGRMGMTKAVAYAETVELTSGDRIITSRFYPHKGGRFDIAQYQFRLSRQGVDEEMNALRTKRVAEDRARARVGHTDWLAMSECSKPVKGKSAEVRITVGVTTITKDRTSCERIGSNKAKNMAADGWSCVMKDARPQEITYVCSEITQQEEDLGLENVRKRQPIWFTYLVFTDLDANMTQISFSNLPNPFDLQLCEAMRQGLVKGGVKDAQCVPGVGSGR